MQNITAVELKKKLGDEDEDEILIDVREPIEHRSSRIPSAKNVPLKELQEVADKLKNIGTVYVHCNSGARSLHAYKVLTESGVNAVNVVGGLQAWQEAGFEVVSTTGKSVISIIRQVMIVSGIMILCGLFLGYFVNQWWYILAALSGGGLLFAGVTGICGMSSLLSCLPWNRT